MMSGSRLGRGRGGRLVVYGVCLLVVVLLIFLYHAATTEMTRLRELHIQCAHQQEALAAQLQVIFEYKVRLEKSLAEEKSSNAMVKQELQQRANREKSLRDKDSVEAMQRFNSLQQQHKLLQSEHKDLTEECNKRQKSALEESNRLESILQDLRSQIRNKDKDHTDKEQLMERLKSKYLKLDVEKSTLETKYNDLVKNRSLSDTRVSHLTKEVFQLKREIDEIKSSCKMTSSDPSLVNPPSHDLKFKASVETKAALPQKQKSTEANSLKGFIQSSTASTTNLSSVSIEKLPLAQIPIAPMKSVSRLKLPMGVVPIPKMLDEKVEKDDNKNAAAGKNIEEDKNSLRMHDSEDMKSKLKLSKSQEGNSVVEAPHIESKHIGDHILNGLKKKENPAWILHVKPGFQEVGELNRDEKIAELDDKQPQDVEEQDDDYRELQLGEEERDEDDQIEDDQIK